MSEVLGLLFAVVLGLLFVPTLSGYTQTANDNTRAATTAQQQKKLIDASSFYVQQYSTNIQSIATATTPAVITVPMLQAVNLLDASFSATNPFGQTWQTQVLQPSAGNLQAFVMSYGGTAMNDKVASKIASFVGAQGGFIPKNDSGIYAPGTAYGNYVPTPTANYASISGGHLAALLTFNNGQLTSNYLYRNAVPGQQQLNTMNTPLILGAGAIGTLSQPCSPVGAFARDSNGAALTCQGTGPSGTWQKASTSPNMYRYVFTSTTTWTVPAGVKSALVTMAGGGGSALGWRFGSQYATGHSGGFVFSAPVNLVAGETLSVIVGAGGLGFSPVNTGVPVTAYPQYTVWGPPAGDDGLGGYPGGPSKLISPSAGALLECDGGSGASVYSADSLSGSVWIPGPQTGAYAYGSGGIPTPNRVATGPYTRQNGPGACGTSNYGLGNFGSSFYAGSTTSLPSGITNGALTPFGYGSGGGVSVTGCYVSPTQIGVCVSNLPGRDGVVMIDVLY